MKLSPHKTDLQCRRRYASTDIHRPLFHWFAACILRFFMVGVAVSLVGCASYRVEIHQKEAYLVPPGQELGPLLSANQDKLVVLKVPVSEYVVQEKHIEWKIPILEKDITCIGKVKITLDLRSGLPGDEFRNKGYLLLSMSQVTLEKFLDMPGLEMTWGDDGSPKLGGSAGFFEEIRIKLENKTKGKEIFYPNAIPEAVDKARISMPWPAERILEHVYNFSNDGNYVLLRPGMMLRINQEAIHYQKEKYHRAMGGSSREVRVLRDRSGNLFFESFASHTPFKREIDKEKEGTAIDLHRKQTARPKWYALRVPSDDYPGTRDPIFPAGLTKGFLVIGADKMSDLYFDPINLDKPPANSRTTFTGFGGRTQIEALIPVRVNGDTEWFPVGASIRDALFDRLLSDYHLNPERLCLRRLYGGKLYTIHFPPADGPGRRSFLNYPLLAGDQLTWKEN